MRQYALGIVLGVVLLLLYMLVRGGILDEDFPILTAIIVTPTVGALLTLLVPARRPEIAQAIGYLATAATAGFAAWLLWTSRPGTAGLPVRRGEPLVRRAGVGYIVGVDGFSIFMVALTALAVPDRAAGLGDAPACG